MTQMYTRSDQPLKNADGFLADVKTWNKEVALELAKDEGLELNQCHWATIMFLRSYYEVYDVAPTKHVIYKALADKFTTASTCSKTKLSNLFPDGGCKQACRIAGLPEYFCHAC